ncbi:DUF4179 domain-containing protein [Paenibacillus sp. IHBB 10380]|uniref:DUF4179 domain-containing protein n=1 Tax=Paenibacillus sp. IHBB 10380 TaxID=1566358 RepID=UPI0005CFE62E|nr:DUF4179 domain-containing protein [Paenibacillus sp. IHBB 10380]AJS58367.1 ECF-type sigma factor negative effector [Paenibacillus sp. IHBB 10380]
MKDIYELLNDINIDETEFEEIEVNELEKAKVKSALKKSLSMKKKIKSWKKNVAVASIIIILSCTTFGITFPAYASSIPVIGDIFSFLNNGGTGSSLYNNYKEHSTEMNVTKESKGIKVTMNDAIYDGNTVSLTYSIESEQDLGENLMIHGNPTFEESKGMAGSSKISKVDEHHYVGIYNATNLTSNMEDTVKIKWDLDSIFIQDMQEEIIGDWEFDFTLKATDSRVQFIAQSAEQDGVKVNIEKISINPMSFIVYYGQQVSDEVRNKWHEVYVELEIKDDLGNFYSGEGNGGLGKDSYTMSLSKTFEKLEQHATKLIVTPHITLRSHNPDNYGSVEITESGPKEIPIPTKSGVGKEDFVLQDIIIELKK